MAIAEAKDVWIRSVLSSVMAFEHSDESSEGCSNWEVKNDASKGDDDCESGVLH